MSDRTLTHPLPDSLQSERMLIAAILDDPAKLLQALPIVRASDFSQPALAQCWNWFETMHAENARISLYSVRQRYGRHPTTRHSKASWRKRTA